MGRLSYINRKIDGLKLGQVIARDLAKRVPPGSGYKAALRDQVVELDVSTKQLKDDGFAEVALALTESIKYNGENGKVVVLEDLSLKDNGLTINSLKTLAPIISLTCNDLRDLDLSNNRISVETSEDILIWENFLRSFADVCVLRRLDLSGNPLGFKAFETLTRVYAKQQRLDLTTSDYSTTAEGEILKNDMSEATKKSDISDDLQEMNLSSDFNQDRKDDDDDTEKGSFKSQEVYADRRVSESSRRPDSSLIVSDKKSRSSVMKGLRSVPYLVLSNTDMISSCALMFSYIVEAHHLPGSLLDFVPAARAGPMQQQLIAYDNETNCRGLIYLPNPILGTAGNKVLDLSEKSRDTSVKTLVSSESSENLDRGSTSIINTARSGAIRGDCPAPFGTPHRKVAATMSPDKAHTNHLTGTLSDLDRARSRVQVDLLDSIENGRLRNDLWRTALKMLSIGRAFQYRKPPPPPPPSIPAPRPQIIKTLEIPGISSKKPRSTSSTTAPLGSANPNKPMTARPSSTQKSNPASNPAATPSGATESLTTSRKPPNTSREKIYRTNLQYGFTEDIWRQIISHAAGADGILSKRQQLLVTRWAMDRKTLEQEREWLVLKEGNQIWHVLDEVKCLAYDGDV